jgi:polysaccharide pyruvyl transferase WcaK-like protein
MPSLLNGLRRVQAIAVGGGALLSDTNLHFPQSLAVLANSARLLDKPIFCLGCSTEGKWSAAGERKIRGFLESCTMIAARDDVTAGRISSVMHRPVPVFGDFCLTEAGLFTEGSRTGSAAGIAINVCRIPAPWDAAQERYERTLVAMANRFLRGAPGAEPRMVRIFTTGTAEDVLPAERVFSRLEGRGVELHVPRSLEQLRGMLHTSAVVLASRLHGAVLALAENVPVIGFSPAPKLRNYLSTMGLAQYSFGTGDRGDLVRCCEIADYQTLFARQRSLLQQAPIWAGRAMVRQALRLSAGMSGGSVHRDIECT